MPIPLYTERLYSAERRVLGVRSGPIPGAELQRTKIFGSPLILTMSGNGDVRHGNTGGGRVLLGQPCPHPQWRGGQRFESFWTPGMMASELAANHSIF